MSNEEKPVLDLDIQIERENNAVSKLNTIVSEFNTDEFGGYPDVEEAMLFYLVTRMAASANSDGEERYTRDYLLRHANAAINTGKDIIEQGRQDGTLPRPFKLIKPKGMH